jgi:cytochrome c
MLKLVAATFLTTALACSSGAFAQEKGAADEASALVKKAVAHFKAVGKDKACADFADSQGAFQMKDLYVFVQGTDNVVLCHGKNAAFNGKDMSNLKDTDGKLFIQEMSNVAKSAGSGWIDYKWVNATTKKIEPKSTYVEKIDGPLYAGAGIYKP